MRNRSNRGRIGMVRTGMRYLVVALSMAMGIAGCDRPPPEAFVGGSASATRNGEQVSIGKNDAGDECTETTSFSSGNQVTAFVFCGKWEQPSVRIKLAGGGSEGDLNAYATSGAWFTSLNARLQCGAPEPATILDGAPARRMQCVQRVGGWPHAALVALVNGKIWLADGVRPAQTVMDNAIGVAAGVRKAESVAAYAAAAGQQGSRIAAQTYGSDDIGQFDLLMKAGTRANIANDPKSAEQAFRRALEIQQKALGKNDPNTAGPAMALAIQLSNGGRYGEADALFNQIGQLIDRTADPTAHARFLQYRGVDKFNRSQFNEALGYLDQADKAYAENIPADALNAKGAQQASNPFTRGTAARLGGVTPAEGLLTDPIAETALLGLIEVRRAKASALRALRRVKEADDLLVATSELARGNGVDRPIVAAPLYRTMGVTAAALGAHEPAIDRFTRSALNYQRAMPGSRAQADTNLQYADQLVRSGKSLNALDYCRSAVASLIELTASTTPELIAPCLKAYFDSIGGQTGQNQTMIGEMFVASQLGQSGIVSQQISQASANLAENSRNPKVGAAIRKQRDLKVELSGLYDRRDVLAAERDRFGGGGGAQQEDSDRLEARIRDVQTKLAEADSELQAASPNFGQLTPQTVKADAIYPLLHPGEAFVSLSTNQTEGWIFVLRDGRISVSRIALGREGVGKLVQAIRASIENVDNRGRPPPFDVASARALFDAVFAPAMPRLENATSVVVAPSGPLLSLPMELLLTGAASNDNLPDAPWLVRKFRIVHIPAPNNFVSLRKIATGSQASLPWFGFGEFSNVSIGQAERSFPTSSCGESASDLVHLSKLPFAKKELEISRQYFGGSPGNELLGGSFTAKNVRDTSLKNYRVLHFATHALLPAELKCQTESAIVTSAPAGAPDAAGALLTASQVAAMDLDANLVILSACNSGGPGGTTKGESLSGLALSFFSAGARSMLVTHWSVHDQVAAYLMGTLIQRMQRDQAGGVTGALREAELKLLAEAGKDGVPAEIAHPYYWAPFAVIGEGLERAGVKLASN